MTRWSVLGESDFLPIMEDQDPQRRRALQNRQRQKGEEIGLVDFGRALKIGILGGLDFQNPPFLRMANPTSPSLSERLIDH